VPLAAVLEAERERLAQQLSMQQALVAAPPSEPVPLAPKRRGRPPGSSQERQAILTYMEDFARELNDQAPLKSSVTRALNLYRQSGLSLDAFIGKLYEARAITKERSGSIRSLAETGRALSPKNRAAYYLAVLEDVLGLKVDDEPEEQLPN